MSITEKSDWMQISQLIAKYEELSSEMLKAISDEDDRIVRRLDAKLSQVYQEILLFETTDRQDQAIHVTFLLDQLSPKDGRSSREQGLIDKLISSFSS